MRHLHELLKELRGARSVADAAKAAEISTNALYSIESAPGVANYRRPSVATLSKLLALYGAAPDQRAAAFEALAAAPESAPTATRAADTTAQGAA